MVKIRPRGCQIIGIQYTLFALCECDVIRFAKYINKYHRVLYSYSFASG